MTVEDQPPLTALARYEAEMRRKRKYYLAVLAVVTAVVVVVVSVAWSRGEITHVTVRTAATPAPSVPVQQPSSTLTQAWRNGDHTASGNPVWGGTVVTFDKHAVRGRDGATGAVLWSYERSNRTVCDAAQIFGVTVAIFEVKGNCDQVTTLDSATGKRKWTRTLAENGHAINGRPAIQITQYTILFTTPDVVYAVDPVSGIDRWQFAQPRCTVNSAVLGSAGALISQTCDKPDCKGKKFCGAGAQLLLRDANAGRSDSDAENPDRITWNLIGNATVPVSADQLISALDPATSRLQILDATKGKQLSTLPLAPAQRNVERLDRLATARAELIHLDGWTYSVQLTGAALFWSAPMQTLPSVTPRQPGQVPDLATATVAAQGTQGVDLLDGGTGKPTRTLTFSGSDRPPAASRIYQFGTGFVFAGDTTAVYR